MSSGSNNLEDEQSNDKSALHNAENTGNQTQRDSQNKDESGKNGSQNAGAKDDESESNDDLAPKIRTSEGKLIPAEEQADKYDNLIKALRKFSQDLGLQDNPEEDTSEKENRVREQGHKTESDVQNDNDILVKAMFRFEYLNRKTRTLEEQLTHAEEQEVKYNKLIQALGIFDQELELESNLKEDTSKKEKRMREQKNRTESKVQYDNDILVKTMSRFRSLTQKTRKTEEEKENLKTDLAKYKENQRKMSEQWKADEKNLKQKIKEKEQNEKEKDKCIRSLKTENEKQTKTLNKKEQVNVDLINKQIKLQQLNEQQKQAIIDFQNSLTQVQFDNKKYQQAVQDRDQRIQHQHEKLQQKDAEVQHLTQALQKSEEERNNLNTRLSKLAGARLTRENPNIADLSDTNRPTKLAERYSELYDNEWTNAFEELCEQRHMDEVRCIKTLLDSLKVTNDECVKVTKPIREILKTLKSVSITLNSDLIHKEQSAGTDTHSLTQSTKPNMGIKKDENIYDNSRSTINEPSEQGQEDMEIEYPEQKELWSNEDNVQNEIEAGNGKLNDAQMMDEYVTHLEISQSNENNLRHGMHSYWNQKSIAKTECKSNDCKIQDENQTDIGQPCDVQMKGTDSTQFKNSQTTQIEEKTECSPTEGKVQDETHADNGQSFDVQESSKQTEGESNEVQYQDEKQGDNGQKSGDIQAIKDTVKSLPEGFSSNVDTGEVSAEVTIDVEFSDEQMKTLSDMRRLSTIRFETEKNISMLIAEKIAFERGIDPKESVQLMAFIAKCAELCWYMAIQEPPVFIEFHEPGDDELFDKDKYKEYTAMGDKLDYVVWPPLYLHSGGAMLCKGTAQGKK